MLSFTASITIYAIAVTFLLYSQACRQRRKLVNVMVRSSSCNTISDLAERGDCTKFRAWIFLIGLRIRRRVNSTPLTERDILNIYGYTLNPRGRSKYQFVT